MSKMSLKSFKRWLTGASHKPRILLVMGIFALIGIGTVFATSAAVPGPLGQTGIWDLKFSDEFDGTSLDTTKWSTKEPWNGSPGYDMGPEGWCPQPLDTLNNPLLNVNNGTLKMNAIAAPINGRPIQTCPITSRDKFNQVTRGYIEASVKLPAGADLWPAFWLLGNGTGTSGWPGTGEVDIFEFVNNGGSNGIPFYTVHYAGPCDQWNHCQKTQDSPYPAAVPNYTTRFVTFGLKRTTTALELYIDGKFAYKFTNDMVNSNGQPLPAVLFENAMHIRFDLGVGGWGDNPNLPAQPGTFEVDYVRYWEPGTSDTTPPAVSITSPLSQATVSGATSLNVTATDNVGVTRVDYLVDGVSVGQTTGGLLSWDTTKLADGPHTLTATAYDAVGNSTTSSPVSITIKNATAPPISSSGTTALPDVIVTSLTSSPGAPLAGQQAVFTAVIKNQGTAEVPVGAITGVGFLVDGRPVTYGATSSVIPVGGSVTLAAIDSDQAPGTNYWTAVAGAHTVTAFVNDVYRYTEITQNNNQLSVGLNVPDTTVAVKPGGDLTLPVVTITKPTSDSSVGRLTVVDASATDNVLVQKMIIQVDGVTTYTSYSNTANWTWNSRKARTGQHTITVKAYDAAGNVGVKSVLVYR